MRQRQNSGAHQRTTTCCLQFPAQAQVSQATGAVPPEFHPQITCPDTAVCPQPILRTWRKNRLDACVRTHGGARYHPLAHPTLDSNSTTHSKTRAIASLSHCNTLRAGSTRKDARAKVRRDRAAIKHRLISSWQLHARHLSSLCSASKLHLHKPRRPFHPATSVDDQTARA